MVYSLLRSHRLSGWFATALALLTLTVVVRLLAISSGEPRVWSRDWFSMLVAVGPSLAAAAALGAGGWCILWRGRNGRGLLWVLIGAVMSLVSMPGPLAMMALILALLAGLQLRQLGSARSAPVQVAVAVDDEPATRQLFRATLATPVVLLALIGVVVKLRLDAAGEPTLSWFQGVNYAMLLLVPFAAGFVGLAFGMRKWLRRRAAVAPDWVPSVGIPTWIGALAGAAAGGAYVAWFLMLDTEASMVVMVMPVYPALFQAGGALVGGALAFVFACVSASRSER